MAVTRLSTEYGRSLGGLPPGHPQNLLEPRQRLIQPQRNQQQFQIVALVGQATTRVPYALRLFRNTVLLRQIIRSEYYVQKAELDAVIAGVPVSFRNLRGMMPTVHLRGDEQIVQEPSF